MINEDNNTNSNKFMQSNKSVINENNNGLSYWEARKRANELLKKN